MIKQIKNSIKTVIVVGISLFLIPTIADIVGNNSGERNFIMSFFRNFGSLLQLIGIITTSSSGIIYFVISLKEKKSEQVLEKASMHDSIWNVESLKYQTRFIFYKIQGALENKKIDSLQNYTTSDFILWFKKIIENNIDTTINTIDIIETRIICCQDFQQNDKDKFVGYLKGTVVQVTGSGEHSKKEFEEAYHFVRCQNDWLLNKIDSDSIWNLISYSSKYEE